MSVGIAIETIYRMILVEKAPVKVYQSTVQPGFYRVKWDQSYVKLGGWIAVYLAPEGSVWDYNTADDWELVE